MSFRAKVRMYRQGLGDCILVTLPHHADQAFHLMIDCGVILGTADASATMAKVLDDIAATTKGRVDLLCATHEHWDHLSGFIQAPDSLKKITFHEVWMGWTEDPNDPLAKTLGADRQDAITALHLAQARLRLAGDDDAGQAVRNLLDFFGAAPGSTRDALEVVRKLTPEPLYRRPTDKPIPLGDTGATAYVLGPPLDQRLLKLSTPTAEAKTYGLAAAGPDPGDRLAAFMTAAQPALAESEDDEDSPFGPLHAIPTTVAREAAFFQARYWGAPNQPGGQDWRRIDSDWMGDATGAALKLDSDTNNTSLVLAIELAPGGDVLLFAADAQTGNWLSWQGLSWTVGTRKVTGPDLLARTVFYKVGHHGSHNATLSTLGLEQMKALKTAMIPVDHDMAVKKHWGLLPLDALVQRLNDKTGKRVVRTDQAAPASLAGDLASEELYYELTL